MNKNITNIDLEPGWMALLHDCFESHYMQNLKEFLKEQKKQGHSIYPPADKVFNAFWKTPLKKVKVVIIGQDPYHGDNQAHGLSFSVPSSVQVPPSLLNIHKELKSDLGIDNSGKGNLEVWATQGVLLLNSVLTVQAHSPGSHAKQGWEIFTDEVIKRLGDFHDNLVFFLWGNYAQNKGDVIDSSKHLIIKSAHPSPLSAHNGFLGSRPFSKCNQYLIEQQKKPINWHI